MVATTTKTASAKRWFPVGTAVTVRKVGTAAYKPYAVKSAVGIPEDAEATDGGRSVRFWVGAWEVTGVTSFAVTTTAAKKSLACNRCSGRGYISAFSHVQGGVCFKCGGHGVKGCTVAF